jgi:DNA-binding SARP family transcriptional activator/tetratricopeptide (TPR) repeat protein/DNA-binding XRE family transcriptional regulator
MEGIDPATQPGDSDVVRPRSGRVPGLGSLVEQRRRVAGLTQQQLAERAGVGVGTVRDLEQGRTSRPRAGSVESLARVLGLSADHLLAAGQAGGGAGQGVWIGVLGPLVVWRAEVRAGLGAERQKAVLALLALQPGSVVTREKIIDAIWGERPPPGAANMIQSYVSRLREAVGQGGTRAAPRGAAAGGGRQRGARRGELLVSAGPGYLLQVSAGQLDVLEFSDLVAQARRVLAAGDVAGACETFERAVRLWRGDPVADVDMLNGHPAVTGLMRRRVAVVLEYAQVAGEAGWHDRVVEHLRALSDAEPLDERVHARLMIALAATGQQAEALQIFGQMRQRLDRELGIAPGPELADVHLQVLRGQVAPAPGAAGATPVASTTAADASGADANDTRTRGSHQGPGTALPQQLPLATRHFAGRSGELKDLWAVLEDARGEAGTVVISAVGGMAGIGKTALAVHWAHQAAGRFPDGQLFADLGGAGPSGTPADPVQVIGSFLGSLGVPAAKLPASSQAQVALYRSILAGKQVLILLDNARDVSQVRPLLPGSPGCLVLVTSRARLTGLAVAEGAHLLDLDVLTEPEALELLARRLGSGPLATDPAAAAELVQLCGKLPLALAITAARAAARPGITLAGLAAELRSEPGRLDALDTGDPASTVRAVFSWSYLQLTPAAARMFRLLGLHPGPDITAPAAVSLARLSPARTRSQLAELTAAHLLAEPAPGRYALHDLLRSYAVEQAAAEDSPADQHAALTRTLDHYLRSAHHAAALIDSRPTLTLPPAPPGVIPEHPADRHEAMTWFEAEHQVLLSAVNLAAREKFGRCAWQLPWAMGPFLHWQGHWQEWAAIQQTAIDAASQLGDKTGQATAHRGAGTAYARLARYDEASRHLACCLRLYRDVGDHDGQARAHQALCWVADHQGRQADALGHAQQALSHHRAGGDQSGQAEALNAVGWCHGLLGDFHQARAVCQQALALHRELGSRHEEAITWDSLGFIEHNLDRPAQAIACYQTAISLFREFGDRGYEAETLTRLGDTHHAHGQVRQARQAWREALRILDDLHHGEADKVRAKLSGH